MESLVQMYLTFKFRLLIHFGFPEKQSLYAKTFIKREILMVCCFFNQTWIKWTESIKKYWCGQEHWYEQENFFFFLVFLLKTKKYENSSHTWTHFSILTFFYINYFHIISVCNSIYFDSFQISQSTKLLHKSSCVIPSSFTYPQGSLLCILSLVLAFWFSGFFLFSFSAIAYFKFFL